MLSGDSTTATLRKRIRPRMRPACGRRSGRGHAPLALYRPAIFWRVLRVKSTYLHCALWPHCSGAARAAPIHGPGSPMGNRLLHRLAHTSPPLAPRLAGQRLPRARAEAGWPPPGRPARPPSVRAARAQAAGTMRGAGPPPGGRESRAWYSPARRRMFSAAASSTARASGPRKRS